MEEKRKKPLAIGIENYKEIIDWNYYYIDKTLFVKELLDKSGKVSLFTRPRRFGKTLALSMLRTFFEDERNAEGEEFDNRKYFTGKKIETAGAEYMQHQGKYPVIFLSLKSAKQPNFSMAYESLKDEIAKEFERHRYVLKSDRLIDENKEKYRAIMGRRGEVIDYAKSLEFLSRCLEKTHGQRTIILLDEYDVPLENSYFQGFYKEMTAFIRSLFESALKTNDSLMFSVVTGCLRISKESIFTGLNNLEIISILNHDYAEFFGFVQSEVDEMLRYYGISEKEEEVKRWYDGYLFGDKEVYNPWSLINYVKTALSERNALPKPYWSNTSSNNIVRKLIENADITSKQEIEALIAGETIEKPVHEEITYEDVYRTQDNLWNFLFFTGYLKMISQRIEEEVIYIAMKIPNAEVRYIYKTTILDWFQVNLKKLDKTPVHQYILEKNCKKLELEMRKFLMESISYHDSAESFYHGYLLGMLQGIPEYVIQSNREAGNGRPDIQLIPYDTDLPAVIIEVKRTSRYQDMEEKCDEALTQIKEKQYAEELRIQGYEKFICYGICFCKKNCRVKVES